MNWLTEKKERAKQLFIETPLPHEDKRTNYSTVQFPTEINDATITSSEKIITEKTLEEQQEVAEKYIGSALFAGDKFSYFNEANWKNVAIVHVPEGTEKKIEVNWKLHEKHVTHTIIIAGENSKVTVVEKTEGKAVFSSECVEFIVGKNAKVNYISLQNIAGEGIRLSTKRALVLKDGTISIGEAIFNDAKIVSDTQITLQEEGACGEINIGLFGEKKQTIEVKNVCIHGAQHTMSEMRARSALADAAHQVYRGMIEIQPNAAHSEGNQQHDTLMLSEEAETDPIPMLKIENNDVRCAHGATVAYIDDAKRFYLESRGIKKEQAEQLLIEAFFEKFYHKYDEDIKEYCKNIVRQKI